MKVEASRFSVHQPRAGLLLRDAAAGGDRRLCCAWKWIWPEERHLSFPVSCRDFLVLHSGGLPWALKTILNRETSIVTLGACSLCRAQTPLRIYFLSLLFSYLSKIASADSLTDTVSLAVTIISPQLFLLGRQWCYWCLQKKKTTTNNTWNQVEHQRRLPTVSGRKWSELCYSSLYLSLARPIHTLLISFTNHSVTQWERKFLVTKTLYAFWGYLNVVLSVFTQNFMTYKK